MFGRDGASIVMFQAALSARGIAPTGWCKNLLNFSTTQTVLQVPTSTYWVLRTVCGAVTKTALYLARQPY